MDLALSHALGFWGGDCLISVLQIHLGRLRLISARCLTTTVAITQPSSEGACTSVHGNLDRRLDYEALDKQ